MSETPVETGSGESGEVVDTTATATADAPEGDAADREAEELLHGIMQEHDPEELLKQLEQARRTSQRHQKSAQQNAAAAARLKELEDAGRSDLEKAVNAQRAAEQERDALRMEHARMVAATAHELDPDLVDFLGTGTDEEIDERAGQLSEIITKLARKMAEQALQQGGGRGPGGPNNGRPVESLRPGGMPSAQAAATVDDMFRQLLHGNQ